ncbi:hypothetical protein [Nocardia sp. Marseille-Q1738]
MLFAAVVAAGAVSLSAQGAAVAAPGDVTTTVALSGRAAVGCAVQATATVAGSSALGLGSNIPPVEFWDDWNFLGSVTPTVNRATPTTGVSLTATIEWKPTTTGNHVLRAKYVGGNYTPESEGSITVNVGNGINLGSACL